MRFKEYLQLQEFAPAATNATLGRFGGPGLMQPHLYYSYRDSPPELFRTPQFMFPTSPAGQGTVAAMQGPERNTAYFGYLRQLSTTLKGLIINNEAVSLDGQSIYIAKDSIDNTLAPGKSKLPGMHHSPLHPQAIRLLKEHGVLQETNMPCYKLEHDVLDYNFDPADLQRKLDINNVRIIDAYRSFVDHVTHQSYSSRLSKRQGMQNPTTGDPLSVVFNTPDGMFVPQEFVNGLIPEHLPYFVRSKLLVAQNQFPVYYVDMKRLEWMGTYKPLMYSRYRQGMDNIHNLMGQSYGFQHQLLNYK